MPWVIPKHDKLHDDFEWSAVYPAAHKAQTLDIQQQGYDFELNNFSFENGKLVTEKPLVPNQYILYETLLEWNPKSVFEVGFGYCNHLYSINKFLPETELNGCDISSKQYFEAQARYPEVVKKCALRVGDFLTLPIDRKYEVVYSNAVVMHMSSIRQRHAIRKMCAISSKYVLLVDGGLVLPDIKEFLAQFGEVHYLEDWAKENWDSEHGAPPLYIDVTKL